MSDESLEVVESNEPVEQEAISEPVKETKKEPAEATSEDAKPEPEEEKREPTEAERVHNGMQKRIDKQTARFKRHEELRINEKAEADSMREAYEKLKAENGKNADDGMPSQDDPRFNTYDEYQDAVVEHRAEKRIAELREADQLARTQEAEQRDHEANQKRFDESVNTFKAERPDYKDKEAVFKEVVDDLVSLHGNNPTLEGLGNFILDSDVSPAIIYELGTNPELAEEIAAMTPMSALRELFKLEQSVKKRKPEKAQPKPRPIKGINPTGKSSKKMEDMTPDELMKYLKV